MKLRVSILVDLVEMNHPGHPTTQRIMGKVIEQDYEGDAKERVKFYQSIKECFEHVISYVGTWLE